MRLKNFFSPKKLMAKRVVAPINLNFILISAVILMLMFGWVMVSSSSMVDAKFDTGSAYFYVIRQAIFVILGLFIILVALFIPTDNYEKIGKYWLIIAFILLIAVLIPGIGKVVNGSRRWIPMGIFNMQVSEAVKLCAIMYFSLYFVKAGHKAIDNIKGIFYPMIILCLMAVLLLKEPDMGASAVMFSCVFGIMFMAGVKIRWFLILVILGVSAAVILVYVSPYRMARVVGYLNPWAEPYGTGYQLSQGLIAFGRGGWFGLGLGNSIQKLFYLPENHTDFILSIIAEEFGAFGVFLLFSAYAVIIYQSIKIALKSALLGRIFSSYVAYGFTFWIAFQVFVNMGVNMGVLPTKGLTLPFISYGGSSLLIMCFIIGILLRIDFENKIYSDMIKPRFVYK